MIDKGVKPVDSFWVDDEGGEVVREEKVSKRDVESTRGYHSDNVGIKGFADVKELGETFRKIIMANQNYNNKFCRRRRQEMMKGRVRLSILLFLICFVIGWLGGKGYAKEFCVSDAIQLQQALTEAINNNEDDTIKLVQGTYVGTFSYSSDELHGLTILGGYNQNCTSRTLDPSNTILDAMGTGRVLYISASQKVNIKIEGITIKNGSIANDQGAGVYISTKGSVEFVENVVTENEITSAANKKGGGAYITADFVMINNDKVENNKINEVVAYSSHCGGSGLYVKGNIVRIKKLVVKNNSKEGGLYTNDYGGGIYVEATNSIELDSSYIAQNSISGGSYQYGGGAFLTAPKVFVRNNFFVENTAEDYAGGVYVSASQVLYFINNSIANNSVNYKDHGGAYLVATQDSAKLYIYNNIFYGNVAPGLADDLGINNDGNNNNVASPVYLKYNDFTAISSPDVIWMKIYVQDNTNLAENPLFADASNGDYHLTSSSPLIDKGTTDVDYLPSTDYDGEPRIYDAAPDIGADEFPSVSVGNIVVNNSTYNFGDVKINENKTATFTVSNNGQGNLYISSVSLFGDSENFSITSNTCNKTTLSQGESCSITVKFAPQSTGTKQTVLKINSNDPDEQVKNIIITGNGIDDIYTLTLLFAGTGSGNVTVLPQEDTFSSTLTHKEISFYKGSVVILKASASDDSSFEGWGEACSGKGDCILTMDGNKTVMAIFTKVMKDVVVSPSEYNFGAVYIGNSLTKEIEITNNGTKNVTFQTAELSPTLDFSIKSDSCSSKTLLPGTKCVIEVEFKPVSSGTKTTELSIKDSEDNVYKVTLKGSALSTVNIKNLSASPVVGTIPLTVQFKVEPEGGSGKYTYEWNFGDGNSSTEQNPVHTYNNPNIYDVFVLVKDSANPSNSAKGYLKVNALSAPPTQPLVIDKLSASPITGVAPLTVSFDISVTGGSGDYTYEWIFGDGKTSTEEKPTHTYEAPGNYTVTVTVKDANDSNLSIQGVIKVIVVGELESYSPVNISSISANPNVGIAPLTVEFKAEASGGSGSYTYSWDFGDGSTSNKQNPTHTYNQPGTYDVKLTVRDANDAQNVATAKLKIIAIENPDILNVSLEASPVTGKAPLNVSFTAKIDGGTPPYTIEWNFGDGTVKTITTNETTATITHTYEKAGNYTVWVHVTSSEGAGVASKSISTSLSLSVSENASGSESFGGGGGCTIAKDGSSDFTLFFALVLLWLLFGRKEALVKEK